MMNQSRTFDETLLSGYLDGELTQADEQRVRLRLEDDPQARGLLDEMEKIRAAARSTTLPEPDDQWDESPRSGGSRWMRRSGWLLVLASSASLAVAAVWALSTSPEAWWEKLLVVALVGGPALLLLSVLSDRLRAAGNDRYRRVRK